MKIKQICLTVLLILGLSCPTVMALEGQLNINTATAKQLQDLPFIGHNKARAIIKYRQQHGLFRSANDLQKTKAIGNSTYEAIKPYIIISGAGNLAVSPTASPENSQMRIMARINTYPGQVVMLADGAYFDIIRSFIAHATKRIDISMFLFKITKSKRNKAAILLSDLINARNRGVTVKVLLEKSGYDPGINIENQRVAKKLRKNRIKVRFDSLRTTTHTKVVVIDGRFSFVGSHNFTHSALGRNHEVSMLIDNRQLANQLLNYIKSIH